jgi:hypothetical protein
MAQKTGKLTVTNEDYTSNWLPVVGEPISIKYNGIDANSLQTDTFYNASSSSLILANNGVTGGKTSKTATEVDLPIGASYTLDYSNAPVNDNQTATNADPHYVTAENMPNLNAWLTKENAIAPGNSLRDVKKLTEELVYYSYLSRSLDDPRVSDDLKTWLPSSDYTFVASMGGENMERIDSMFNSMLKDIPGCNRQDSTSACGVVAGDEQQFAVATALIADAKGFDTRVVVGATIEDGKVYGHDLTAWAEVRANQNEPWTPIYTEPRADNKVPVTAPQPVPNEYTTDTHRNNNPLTTVPDSKPQTGNVSNSNQSNSAKFWAMFSKVAKTVLFWLFLLGIIFLPFIAVILAKIIRRKKRSKILQPEAAIAAGWRELVDYLSDTGYSYPSKATTRKVYAKQFNNKDIDYLAQIADRAVYGNIEPNAPVSLNYWEVLQSLFKTSTAKKSLIKRLKTALSLKSIVRK